MRTVQIPKQHNLSLIIPSEIPVPNFAFNQTVYCKYGKGIVRGLEYIDQDASDVMGFDSAGWWYNILLEKDNPIYRQTPFAQLPEEEIRVV
jgi:hypothetical protein